MITWKNEKSNMRHSVENERRKFLVSDKHHRKKSDFVFSTS